MTSATDTIRAMLDERGVEWRGGLPTETMVEADGLDLLYVALPDGRVRAFIRNYLTPEQAIEATLGSDLEAENIELRELVRDMWDGYHDPRCEECHLKDTPTCADCPICEREGAVIDRMRELGIEVDA